MLLESAVLLHALGALVCLTYKNHRALAAFPVAALLLLVSQHVEHLENASMIIDPEVPPFRGIFAWVIHHLLVVVHTQYAIMVAYFVISDKMHALPSGQRAFRQTSRDSWFDARSHIRRIQWIIFWLVIHLVCIVLLFGFIHQRFELVSEIAIFTCSPNLLACIAFVAIEAQYVLKFGRRIRMIQISLARTSSSAALQRDNRRAAAQTVGLLALVMCAFLAFIGAIVMELYAVCVYHFRTESRSIRSSFLSTYYFAATIIMSVTTTLLTVAMRAWTKGMHGWWPKTLIRSLSTPPTAENAAVARFESVEMTNFSPSDALVQFVTRSAPPMAESHTALTGFRTPIKWRNDFHPEGRVDGDQEKFAVLQCIREHILAHKCETREDQQVIRRDYPFVLWASTNQSSVLDAVRGLSKTQKDPPKQVERKAPTSRRRSSYFEALINQKTDDEFNVYIASNSVLLKTHELVAVDEIKNAPPANFSAWTAYCPLVVIGVWDCRLSSAELILYIRHTLASVEPGGPSEKKLYRNILTNLCFQLSKLTNLLGDGATLDYSPEQMDARVATIARMACAKWTRAQSAVIRDVAHALKQIQVHLPEIEKNTLLFMHRSFSMVSALHGRAVKMDDADEFHITDYFRMHIDQPVLSDFSGCSTPATFAGQMDHVRFELWQTAVWATSGRDMSWDSLDVYACGILWTICNFAPYHKFVGGIPAKTVEVAKLMGADWMYGAVGSIARATREAPFIHTTPPLPFQTALANQRVSNANAVRSAIVDPPEESSGLVSTRLDDMIVGMEKKTTKKTKKTKKTATGHYSQMATSDAVSSRDQAASEYGRLSDIEQSSGEWDAQRMMITSIFRKKTWQDTLSGWRSSAETSSEARDWKMDVADKMMEDEKDSAVRAYSYFFVAGDCNGVDRGISILNQRESRHFEDDHTASANTLFVIRRAHALLSKYECYWKMCLPFVGCRRRIPVAALVRLFLVQCATHRTLSDDISAEFVDMPFEDCTSQLGLALNGLARCGSHADRLESEMLASFDPRFLEMYTTVDSAPPRAGVFMYVIQEILLYAIFAIRRFRRPEDQNYFLDAHFRVKNNYALKMANLLRGMVPRGQPLQGHPLVYMYLFRTNLFGLRLFANQYPNALFSRFFDDEKKHEKHLQRLHRHRNRAERDKTLFLAASDIMDMDAASCFCAILLRGWQRMRLGSIDIYAGLRTDLIKLPDEHVDSCFQRVGIPLKYLIGRMPMSLITGVDSNSQNFFRLMWYFAHEFQRDAPKKKRAILASCFALLLAFFDELETGTSLVATIRTQFQRHERGFFSVVAPVVSSAVVALGAPQSLWQRFVVVGDRCLDFRVYCVNVWNCYCEYASRRMVDAEIAYEDETSDDEGMFADEKSAIFTGPGHVGHDLSLPALLQDATFPRRNRRKSVSLGATSSDDDSSSVGSSGSVDIAAFDDLMELPHPGARAPSPASVQSISDDLD